MFDKSFFPFDPEKMMEMFKAPDFAKMMSDMKLPAMKPEELMATQKKNMDALMAANKAAAAGYQDLFKKQVAIFEDTMSEAQKHISDFDASKMPADGTKQAEIAQAAMEKALSNMTALAEAAQKANQEAFEIVTARIKASMDEIREIAQTAGK
ncbi:MAG: TIGR01841 family phasin [Pseudomonadota bacterium]